MAAAAAAAAAGRPRSTEARPASAPATSTSAPSTASTSGQLVLVSPSTLVAAGAAGIVSRSFVHPFDTLRACMQIQTRPTTLRQLATSLIASEGPAALYRGYSVSLLFTPFASATFFGSYELAKNAFGSHNQGLLAFLASGICAEVVSGVIWTPLDVLKQRMQVRAAPEYYRTRTAISAIYHQSGLRGFFRGYFACLSSFGPSTAIYFTSYEYLKKSAATLVWGSPEAIPSPAFFGLAGLAAGIAAGATNPLDVIKTRIQVARSGSFWSIAKAMLREEGIRSFTRGISARCLQASPSGALSMGSFELFRRKLNEVPV